MGFPEPFAKHNDAYNKLVFAPSSTYSLRSTMIGELFLIGELLNRSSPISGTEGVYNWQFISCVNEKIVFYWLCKK